VVAAILLNTEALALSKDVTFDITADFFSKYISRIKFANGRIPRKPKAAKAIDRTLLEGLYENSK
jgi:hypothetical protein